MRKIQQISEISQTLPLYQEYMAFCREKVSVAGIIAVSGAEKLQVYPILFELEQERC